MSRDLSIFLCHASADKQAVRQLYRKLDVVPGLVPWLDEENLLPGQEWELEIRNAIARSDVVVVCLSRSSVNKEGYVQKEIRRALDLADEKPEGTIFLIPLRLELCDVPSRLAKWQWVDLFVDTGFERLLSALQARSESLGIASEGDGDITQVAVATEMDRIAHILRMPRTHTREIHQALSQPTLPVWLQRSVFSLGRLVDEMPEAIRRASESKSYLVSIVRYTDIHDNLICEQDQLVW